MRVRLGEIATKITKGTTPTSIGYQFAEAGVNFIKIESISDSGDFLSERFAYISEECNSVLARSRLEENDILFSIAGAIGRVAIVNKDLLPANTNQALAIIRLRKDTVYYPYVKYALQSDSIRKQAERKKQGVAQLNLSLKDISEFEINLPSIADQRTVAELFRKVDSLIEKRNLQLEKLDLLIKSQFTEMFGDPIENTQNRQTTEFINVVKMQRGFDLPVQDRKQNGDVPVFGSNGALDRHNIAKIYGGGIITGRSGTIGKVYYTEGDYWPLNTSLFSVDMHGNNIVYLAYLLQMYDLSRFTEGTGVPTLNRNKFHNKPIIYVPRDEQDSFAQYVKQIEKSKSTIKRSLEKLETLKKALMQKYFG